MNEMWFDCWTNTSNNVYSQQYPAYDELNWFPMLESNQSYNYPYKPKQHFTHYNKSPDIQNECNSNNIESTYRNPEDDQPKRKVTRRRYPQLSQSALNKSKKTINNHELSSLSSIETEPDRSSLHKTRNKKIISSTALNNLCLVCGDQSSGIHYGVNTCEGCKGFFRRALSQDVPQRCNNMDDCEITILNRNSCQYCRLKKCFNVGMSRDASRLGRPPKRLHSVTKSSHIHQQTSLKKSSNSIFPNCLFQHRQKIFLPKIHQEILRKLSSMLIYQEKFFTNIEVKELDHLAEVIIHAHLQFNVSTFEKIQTKVAENLPIATDSINDRSTYEPEVVWANWQSNLPYEDILRIFKSYSFFQEISSNDQICLLRYGAFENMLVNWFILFDIKRNLMLTQDFSAYMDRDFIKTMDTLGVFMLEIFDLGIKANSLPWTDSDIALFNALLMMNPERPNLCDRERIKQIEAKLMQVLHRHLRRYHPNELNMFFDILQLIPLIQEINHTHLNAIQYIKQHKLYIFNSLPDIHQEIF